jgi:DNA-binding ferritin-like protein
MADLRLSASPVDADSRQAVVDLLGPIFEQTAKLAATVWNAHHRVRGPMFLSLHPWLGEFYDAIGEHADKVAERIAALGGETPVAPGGDAMPRDGMAFCEALYEASSVFLVALHEARAVCAEAGYDDTFDLLTTIIRPFEERWVWFLASTVDVAEDEEETDEDEGPESEPTPEVSGG